MFFFMSLINVLKFSILEIKLMTFPLILMSANIKILFVYDRSQTFLQLGMLINAYLHIKRYSVINIY